MPRVLITGVAGFLGGRFAKWLLENVCGAEVHGIDNLSCGYEENVPAGVEWSRFALGDCPSPASYYDDPQFDYVFHFAAYAAEGLSPFIRQYNYRNNLLATAEIVNLCIEQNVKRLVFTSSMAAYGNPFETLSSGPHYRAGIVAAPFCEHHICNPIDPYGIAKLACEQDIRCAGEQHGLDYCIIRPHNLYGPGQSIWQKYRNVLGLWMRARIEGKPLLVYGDGQQRRAFSWIDDCLPCLWQAAVAPEASRELVNLGGAKPVTIRETADLVADVTSGGAIEHREPRHEVKDAWCTTAKSERLLGYRESTSLAEGLSRMWFWARMAYEKYPERREHSERFNVEVRKGLYPYWRELLQ